MTPGGGWRCFIPVLLTACILTAMGGSATASMPPSASTHAIEDLPVVDRVTAPELESGWRNLRIIEEEAERAPRPPHVTLEGVLEQESVLVRPLAEGGGRVGEWFIRADDGTIVACAVESPPSPPPAVGERVVMSVATAGLLEAVGRDGKKRTWPLNAARFLATGPAASGFSGPRWVVGPILVLLIVWMVLAVRIRRSSPARVTVDRPGPVTGPGEEDLPDDPAEALSRLAALHDGESGEDQTKKSSP
ncbi:MAG: hypothetical protein CMJ34_15160 [Phycisphaerae bacterium]|nr:hypothetical protein [Phycisphaerae bacterium]